MPRTYSQKRLIQGIYEGEYSKYALPEFLFEFTFEELIESVEKGFGGGTGDFLEGTTKEELANSFRLNINTFGGAKTFQEVDEMTKFLFNEKGFKLPFKEFMDIAKPLDDVFNKSWLKTELDTSFGQSQSAEQWVRFDEDKDIFPLLQYQTADDERVRHSHAQWDNLIFPVDHPFWDTRNPLNGYNCRCRVIQLSEGKASKYKGVESNKEKVFADNAGKSGKIFTDKHPYYKVKKEDQPLTKNNFGLGFK